VGQAFQSPRYLSCARRSTQWCQDGTSDRSRISGSPLSSSMRSS